ncbi:MAG: MBL fold metallo-hydrolase [Nitrospira sp.]|nr:MBL fold metallo-hydrolase [Nitrospira sp.]
MNRSIVILVLLGTLVLSFIAIVRAPSSGAQSHLPADTVQPELAYLKQVNQWRPPSDPQLLFLLMQQFANTGRHVEGIVYLEDVLNRFTSRLTDNQMAQYLVAIAFLRADHAYEVFLFKRFGWVRDTLALLDDAKRLTKNEMFIARWMSGVVRARIPGFFGERDTALADLLWCVEHVDAAPHRNWLREVYAQLASLHRQRGDTTGAERYQTLIGAGTGNDMPVFTTPFAEDPSNGHTFMSRTIREVLPGTVYCLSGFEFTEYYFVVSADRQELIAIDAGTRPDSAQAAYEALRNHVPSLPPLTTVFVTHAHWDHVGGHRYFRSLNPAVRFYGRSNYQEELSDDALGDPTMLRRFFGEKFRLDDVLTYKPDVLIDGPRDVVIGETHFRLIPTSGGETSDALLVHMPDEGVLFVGDILMPYLGAPFVPEGSVDGLLEAINQVDRLKPEHLLHGHVPLTRLFSSTAMLDDLRIQLTWLRDEVLRAMKAGTERGVIQQANLIPPTLANSASDVHLAYLVIRENMINRLFQQNSGYWQNGLHGLDALTDADHGAALVDYFGLSDSQLAAAAERMSRDGRHELAANYLRWGHARLPDSPRLNESRRLAYLKLMDKYQEFNPFKLIVYAGEINQPVVQINETARPQ